MSQPRPVSLTFFSSRPPQTYKVDRDAACHFIRAAAANESVKRFLLISYTGSRRAGASWWPEGEWDEYNNKVNYGVLATYYQAKIVADEVLHETTKKSPHLVGIGLRPGTLTDDPAGNIEFGKTSHVKGNVPRETVAQVANTLLAAEGLKSGWYDLLAGDENIDTAVSKAIKDGVDSAEGEAIYKA